MIETKRLKIVPLTIEEFRLLLLGTDKMEQALGLTPSSESMDEYTQMAMEYNYKEALKYPDNYIWYTSWQIILKSENKAIASACFKYRPDENGQVEIGYGTNLNYRNQAYMTEAVQELCKWALEQPGVKRVIAETDKANIASQRVLEKCGMVRYKVSNIGLWWHINNVWKDDMRIISVRENPEYKDIATKYLQSKWTSVWPVIYEDSISNSILATNPLPQWYLLEKGSKIIGCTGLITNDFISRMDLYPWICALYIDEGHRGYTFSSLLIDKAKDDAIKSGFKSIYLCTDHIGFYEKYEFNYMGQGYHPCNNESRIYGINLRHIPDYRIRVEEKKDYDEIYTLIKTAFETAKVKDGDEQDFAVNLRKSENYIPQLAFVAESEGKLIGHIMFTKTYVKQSDGSQYEGLLIAPLSVLQEYRNVGVGSALIKEGFKRAKDLGYKAVFLCGDPVYYHRFGFRSTASFGIKYIHDVPEQYIMTYELEQGALDNVTGSIDCQ